MNNKINTHLLCYVFYNSSPRLYYTTLKIFKKPFDMSKHNHRQIYYELLNIIKNNIINNTSDIEILKTISNYLKTNFYNKNINTNTKKTLDNRLLNRINDFSILLNNDLNNIENYLDFGCDNGNITYMLGNYLGLDKKSIYGIDLIDCNNSKITYTKQNITKNKLNFNDNSFSFITMLMVLHHLKNPLDILKEVYRILKPNGLLIIREHDIDGDNDIDGKTYLDILHLYYDYVYNTLEPHNNYSTISNYKSKEKWTELITSIGFKHITSDININKLYNLNNIYRKYTSKSKIENPYNFYYAVYRKI